MSIPHCPGCRVRLVSGFTCPRCGCDLTLVRRADAQAQQLLRQALQAWAHGDGERAKTLVYAALEIERSPLAKAVLQCLQLPYESAKLEAPQIALASPDDTASSGTTGIYPAYLKMPGIGAAAPR